MIQPFKSCVFQSNIGNKYRNREVSQDSNDRQ